MKKMMMALLCAGALLTACKKDKGESPSSTREKLLGKWTFVQSIYKATDVDGVEADTTVFETGSELTFNDNGTYKSILVVNNWPDETNGNWSINNEGKIIATLPNVAAGNVLEIRTLTKTDLELYTKDVDGTFTGETFIKLRR